MKTEKQQINGQECNVLRAEEGYMLQIKAECSDTGEAIKMGNNVILGNNFWVTGSPIKDCEDFYEEVEVFNENKNE